MIVVKPIDLTATAFTSSDVQEVAPAAYAAGTTYALGNFVSVAGTLGLQNIYRSLQNTNLGRTPASNPTWWELSGTVYDPYSAGTTYVITARVQDNSTHKIYQSLVAANLGNALTDATKWSYVSPTNKYKAVDTSNSTKAAKSGSMTFSFTPAQVIGALALLNLTGATSARVRMTDATYGVVYDTTTDLSALPPAPAWWSFWFGTRLNKSNLILQGLPSFPNAVVQIDLVGGASLAVGVIMMGQPQTIGNSINYGARVGIRNFSVIETNAYGDDVLIVRAFAKRGSFTVTIAKDEVDPTQDYLADLRSTPCLFIGSDCYNATVIFGFYQDFDILIERYATSECSVEIKGMT